MTGHNLNKYEKSILILLYNSRIELTTSQIADKLDISWATANKYLNHLYNETHLVKKEEGNRVYWMYWTRFMDLPDDEKDKWLTDEQRAQLDIHPKEK